MLRVVSGTAKGHKLKTVKGNTTRPTSDRVKESIFNIISGIIVGKKVLDIYSGTGNLGIEALSRGSEFAVFIDKSKECSDIINDNLLHTKLIDKALIITADAFMALNKISKDRRKFDIIFLDPPYHKNLVEVTLNFVVESDIIECGGMVIAEHDFNDEVPKEVGCLKMFRQKKYGDTIVSFYRDV